jgi:hypothetical protein
MGGISILGIISFSILFYDTLSPTDFFIWWIQ